jgi:hypothetical protein
MCAAHPIDKVHTSQLGGQILMKNPLASAFKYLLFIGKLVLISQGYWLRGNLHRPSWLMKTFSQCSPAEKLAIVRQVKDSLLICSKNSGLVLRTSVRKELTHLVQSFIRREQNGTGFFLPNEEKKFIEALATVGQSASDFGNRTRSIQDVINP